MALSANTVWEVRTAGADTNGGGFVTGASGTDFSQQNSANSGGNNSSTTDAVAVGTTTITSATASFTAAIVGNIIYLAGGTGSLAAGWYQVTTFTNVTTIVVDRTVAAGTGITMNIGGAFGSPGGAGKVMAASGVAGMKVYIKSGTYTLANTTVNTSSGPVQFTVNATSAAPIVWEGYNATRGDLGTSPVISAGSQTTLTIMGSNSATGIATQIRNITADGNSGTGTRGFDDAGVRITTYKCKAQNCKNNGFDFSGSSAVVYGQVTNCTPRGINLGSSSTVSFTEAYANGNIAISLTGSSSAVGCISYGNTSASGDGFFISGPSSTAISCTSYGNSRAGFTVAQSSVTAPILINCIAEGNAGFGFYGNGGATYGYIINCATFSNTSGGIDPNLSASFQTGNIAYTASAFVNAAGNNFALNNTAGGGASLRAAGFIGTMPRGTSIGYIDIGALQHQDSGGSTTTNIFIIDD